MVLIVYCGTFYEAYVCERKCQPYPTFIQMRATMYMLCTLRRACNRVRVFHFITYQITTHIEHSRAQHTNNEESDSRLGGSYSHDRIPLREFARIQPGECCACMRMRATLDLFTELWIYQSSATASLSFICIPKIPNGILLLCSLFAFRFSRDSVSPESSKWNSYFWLFYFNFDLFSPIFISIFFHPTIFYSKFIFDEKKITAKGKNTIIIIISEALTARPIVVRRKESVPLYSRSRSVSHKYDFLTRNPQIEYIIIIRVRQKPAKQIMLRFMWCGGNGFGYTTCGWCSTHQQFAIDANRRYDFFFVCFVSSLHTQCTLKRLKSPTRVVGHSMGDGR